MPQPRKKKPDPEAELRLELEGIKADANKKYGNKVRMGNEVPKGAHLPFRSPAMNVATNGGPRFGRTMSFWGDPKAGKSRNCYELAAQIQGLPGTAEETMLPRIAYHVQMSENADLSDKHRKIHENTAKRLQDEIDQIREMFPRGGWVAWVDTEDQYDPLYAASIGVDNKRVMLMEMKIIEEICEMLTGLFSKVPLVIIDSTSMAVSKYRAEKAVGDQFRGIEARQWKESMKLALNYFDPHRNMMVLVHHAAINQTTQGKQVNAGQFLRYITSTTIRFQRGAFAYMDEGVLTQTKPGETDTLAGRAEADGAQVFATVESSRLGPEGQVAGLQFSYRPPVGYVRMHEFYLYALHNRIIVKGERGGWHTMPDGSKLQGVKKVYAYLEEQDELRDLMMCQMMDQTHYELAV